MFVILNGFVLMGIVFIPFPTHVLAESFRYESKAAAVSFLSLNLLVTAILFNLQWRYAAKNLRLLNPKIKEELVLDRNKKMLISVFLFLFSSLMSFVNSNISIGIYLIFPFVYILLNLKDRKFVKA